MKWNFLPYCDKEEWEIKTRDSAEANMVMVAAAGMMAAVAVAAVAAAAVMMNVEADVTAERTAEIAQTG